MASAQLRAADALRLIERARRGIQASSTVPSYLPDLIDALEIMTKLVVELGAARAGTVLRAADTELLSENRIITSTTLTVTHCGEAAILTKDPESKQFVYRCEVCGLEQPA